MTAQLDSDVIRIINVVAKAAESGNAAHINTIRTKTGLFGSRFHEAKDKAISERRIRHVGAGYYELLDR